MKARDAHREHADIGYEAGCFVQPTLARTDSLAPRRPRVHWLDDLVLPMVLMAALACSVAITLWTRATADTPLLPAELAAAEARGAQRVRDELEPTVHQAYLQGRREALAQACLAKE